MQCTCVSVAREGLLMAAAPRIHRVMQSPLKSGHDQSDHQATVAVSNALHTFGWHNRQQQPQQRQGASHSQLNALAKHHSPVCCTLQGPTSPALITTLSFSLLSSSQLPTQLHISPPPRNSTALSPSPL